ncbi:PREDICTED: leucine-rich alpha-2-glycoprotein [Gavialis gangeticus]|uniref:leucine-rich alpha-2-glycoprotein n=1 Tax=Gavialis gangeticus TaxID=94835 RepID=UPI00092F4512|nr:PREDICTED: leucine-rich alpha-2-glycoprotein [Gavialis gangeticus]XP_019368963.1 PREDICTED: leucine-rich alpha-2-glycoprotein [Gavialis gangeticus]XP_019368964.1 PREDICTED: leucine-rich alpha-2-glycoprotein [Gavialis gangeticus]
MACLGLTLLAPLLLALPCSWGQPCPPVPRNATAFVCTAPDLYVFPSGLPSSILSISVEFTNLSAVSEDALQGLPLLQELHLSSNRLHCLPAGLLWPVPELRVLDLTGNLLEDLPPKIFCASRLLQHLVLEGNRLGRVQPSWFRSLGALQWLDISGNQLQKLPPHCFLALHALQSLDLSHNFLSSLPAAALEGLAQLERLNLEGNRLQVLAEDTFHPTCGLRYLFLQNNSLSALPDAALLPLRRLDTLDLSHNALHTLDFHLPEPREALGLDLSGNPWVCDCHAAHFLCWLRSRPVHLYARNQTLCQAPPERYNRSLATLAESELGVSCPLAPRPGKPESQELPPSQVGKA